MSEKCSGFRLSAASKTFLVGEYAVLHGARAAVLAHQPRFALQIEKSDSAEALNSGFNILSPAGKWIRSHAAEFSQYKMSFVDPHGGRGGFGASSAQYLFARVLSELRKKSFSDMMEAWPAEKIWQDFRELHQDMMNLPSGADVMAQLAGQLTRFSYQPFHVDSSPWPFVDLDFLIVPTGFKVPTHEHLRERLPVSEALLQFSSEAVEKLEISGSEAFLKVLRLFADELEMLQLVTAETRGLLARWSSHAKVLMVKGCGALGADAFMLLCRPEDRLALTQDLSREGFEVMASRADLSEGLLFGPQVSSVATIQKRNALDPLLESELGESDVVLGSAPEMAMPLEFP